MLETAGKSLRHSCRTELTRQGISRPWDRYSYGRRLPGLQFRACTPPFNLPAPGRRQTLYVVLSTSQSPVFLVNSRHPLVCAPRPSLRWNGALLSRSYEGNLPSSFNTILSSALVYSTSPPVSVSGTVYMAGLFPGSPRPPSQSNKGKRLPAFVTPARLGNINPIPIDYAFQPRLRGRLTLRGLTLRRNPWTFGDRVSHSVYRYSCQHSHFRYLQQTLRFTFTGLRNAPLPRFRYQ